MYPTCCIGGALGGGGGAEAYKLHLSKSQFRKSAQTHITTLPTNFSSTGELKHRKNIKNPTFDTQPCTEMTTPFWQRTLKYGNSMESVHIR